MKPLENKKKQSKWGGERSGSGRKKGKKGKKALEKDRIERTMKERIMHSADALLNSQMNLARGTQMLFKVVTTVNNSGKRTKQKPVLITDQEEIEQYLAGDFEDEDSVYYFITTERPDNKAIDSLFDRTFGKAVQKQELTGPDGGALKIENVGINFES